MKRWKVGVFFALKDGAVSGFWLDRRKFTGEAGAWYAFGLIVAHAETIGARALWCELM